MNDYLVYAAIFMLIYFSGSFYFMYDTYKKDLARKQNINMAVEAMANAIKSQQDTIERLERLVVKATSGKECK